MLKSLAVRFLNSELFYKFLSFYIGRHIRQLQNPTNEKILKELKWLQSLASHVIPNQEDRAHEARVFKKVIGYFEGEDSNYTRKIKRTIELMGERYLKTFLVDLLAERMGIGHVNRKHNRGPYLEFVVIQPTSRCNCSCQGCFADKDTSSLDYKTLDKVIGESKDLTARMVIVLGGEPLLEKDNLLKLFARYNRMPFLLYTNGKLLDEATAKEIADLGNVITFLNIPGLEKTTNYWRRDSNGWKDIASAAENLSKYKAAAGFSSTVSNLNHRELSSESFVEKMIEFNMILGFYFPHQHALGCPANPELDLTPELNNGFSERIKTLSSTYPIILLDTSNGEETILGCLAAKGSFVYVRSDGNAAACPLIPQSDDSLNVRNHSLADILSGPYFRHLRNLGKGHTCLARSKEFKDQVEEYQLV